MELTTFKMFMESKKQEDSSTFNPTKIVTEIEKESKKIFKKVLDEYDKEYFLDFDYSDYDYLDNYCRCEKKANRVYVYIKFDINHFGSKKLKPIDSKILLEFNKDLYDKIAAFIEKLSSKYYFNIKKSENSSNGITTLCLTAVNEKEKQAIINGEKGKQVIGKKKIQEISLDDVIKIVEEKGNKIYKSYESKYGKSFNNPLYSVLLREYFGIGKRYVFITNKSVWFLSMMKENVGISAHYKDIEIDNESCKLVQKLVDKMWSELADFVRYTCDRWGYCTSTNKFGDIRIVSIDKYNKSSRLRRELMII